MAKTDAGEIGEALLDAWVNISISVVNERVVSLMTYKETLVCRELYQAGSVQGTDAPGLTATELCQATRMVKSQMNHILTSLEGLGAVTRERSRHDRRRVEVFLDASPEGLYLRQHRLLVDLVARIADQLGHERAWQTVAALTGLADAADEVLPGFRPAGAVTLPDPIC